MLLYISCLIKHYIGIRATQVVFKYLQFIPMQKLCYVLYTISQRLVQELLMTYVYAKVEHYKNKNIASRSMILYISIYRNENPDVMSHSVCMFE